MPPLAECSAEGECDARPGCAVPLRRGCCAVVRARTAIPRDTGLPVRRPGRVHPRSDPHPARGQAQARARRHTKHSAPASRSQAPAQAHAPQRQHATLHAQRYNAVSTPHPVRTILCRARRGSDVALGSASLVAVACRLAPLPGAGRARWAGPWGRVRQCARTSLGAFQSCTDLKSALQNS